MNTFLTIPEAPNYEINADLKVRNKTTGRILSSYRDSRFKNAALRVSICVNGKLVSRLPEVLRIQALENVYGTKFAPILSTQGKYEIDKKGHVRNAETKRLLNKNKRHGNTVLLSFGDRSKKCCSIASLLWETFGIIKKGKRIRVPIIISKGNCRLYFDNKTKAAKYLAPRIFLSFWAIYRYFRLRKTTICGWRINYQC